MSGFGFEKAKRPTGEKTTFAKKLADRLPDLSVDSEAEQRAVEAGEKAGFIGREETGHRAESIVGRRRKQSEPQGRLLVTGPERVLSRFRNFSDENDFKAYWNALEKLMDEHG